MKKLLLITLVLYCSIAGAQNTIDDKFGYPDYVYDTVVNTVPDSGDDCFVDFAYSINYDVKTFAAALVLDFYTKSSDSIVKYLWDFGDGTTSNEPNPTHIFTFPIVADSVLGMPSPMRDICLTVTMKNGCESSICHAINIYMGDDPVNPYPIYDCFIDFAYSINYDVQTFAPALVLDFYTKESDSIVKYLWDFGDGTTSNEPNPTHIFSFPTSADSAIGMTYPLKNVCLTITRSNGCDATMCQLIDIYMGTRPVEPSCYAWFKYNTPDDIVSIPEEVVYKFTPYSENEVLSYKWEFEDGTFSYEREPIKSFDIFRYSQFVCLTILTVDSCISTWCETLYFYTDTTDTTYHPEPICDYTFRYDSYYPVTASACIGTCRAQVVLGDKEIPTEYYYWSTGVDGADIDHLCPTQIYTVTALTKDGCKFSGSFIFNSDGTVTEVPVNWWITEDADSLIRYTIYDSSYSVEWIMCDGSIITGDSIYWKEIECANSEANLIVKDKMGNVIYNEIVDLKAGQTVTRSSQLINEMTFYPVPVKEILNIRIKDFEKKAITFEVLDMNGRILISESFTNNNTGGNFSVNVSSLPGGMYIGKVTSENKLLSIGKFNK